MTRARAVAFSVTTLAWLGVCGVVLWGLVRKAGEAQAGTIDEYARAPSFQVLNFAVGYLPRLVLLLLVLLGFEHAILRMVESRGGARRSSREGA